MSFGDTIALTVGGVSKTLNFLSRSGQDTVYRLTESTGYYQMKIRHVETPPKGSKPGYVSHNAELSYVLFATSTTPETKDSTSHTMKPPYGSAPSVNLEIAMCDWMKASTNAAATKLQNGEG